MCQVLRSGLTSWLLDDWRQNRLCSSTGYNYYKLLQTLLEIHIMFDAALKADLAYWLILKTTIPIRFILTFRRNIFHISRTNCNSFYTSIIYSLLDICLKIQNTEFRYRCWQKFMHKLGFMPYYLQSTCWNCTYTQPVSDKRHSLICT